jgi:hypothetical protein
MAKPDLDHPDGSIRCSCFSYPLRSLTADKALGMDEIYAEVSILFCPLCGQHWLRYFYEVEAFTASGRWHLGAISVELADKMTAAQAKAELEGLDWYFYGGSYFGGRIGRASGEIVLNP